MIIRSICIWIALFFLLVFLMNPITSRSTEHTQRLLEIDEDIAKIKKAHQRETKLKSYLLQQREELSKNIDKEIENAEHAKRLLKISE